ncbi:MAG: F510_1955 family glycosylhydrolase, partial [Actinomycetota bacterium]
MRSNRTARAFSAAAAVLLALAGCSSDGPGGADRSRVGKPARISHIHGLGVDSAGTLHVATHFGLIKAAGDGGWVYASADTNDHMGFSLHPGGGVMYRSGHSSSRPSLGVETSTDGARWTHLSDVADPTVDFHAMAVSLA